jgi:endonuclease/exonuclease/phosphatase (EEP) superfamily protein YafD
MQIQLFLTALLVIAVILPLVRNDYWIFRILEYPRFQKFVLCSVMLLFWTIPPYENPLTAWGAGAMLLCCVYLFYKIFPYTALSKKEMASVQQGNSATRIKLFTANVYQDNDNYDLLLAQIAGNDPDIVFLVETDQKWEDGLKELNVKFPHTLAKPLPNTYGMLLYSKLELVQADIKFLVENDVPSAHIVVRLKSGQPLQFYGLHPKPPVPKEDIRSNAKDKELMKVAGLAAQNDLPVIVMGDLNDVAWSYTTELFRKSSHLLDPRRGRGFYSTYSAKNPLMRFPLDYVFCSNDFGLVEMKRLPRFGSDHFAMFIHLQYDPDLRTRQKAPSADREEKSQAEEKRNAEPDN